MLQLGHQVQHQTETITYYENGSIPWLKTGDLNDGVVNFVPEHITEKALNETSVKLNNVGSVLIAMYGATIGKVGILNLQATTNQACCAGYCNKSLYNKFLFYFLLSQRESFKQKGEGGAQPNISKEKIIGTLIPLPPLEEQQRIVEAIENLTNNVSLIDEEYSALEEKIALAKSKLLDLAIRGKLLPQNPNDKLASKLLEKIRKEKEATQTSKGKRKTTDSYIFKEDNL